MRIKLTESKNNPITVDQLKVGEQFVYEGKLYMKISPLADGELQNAAGSGPFNAVKLENGGAFIFRNHHKVTKVLTSEYTYSI